MKKLTKIVLACIGVIVLALAVFGGFGRGGEGVGGVEQDTDGRKIVIWDEGEVCEGTLIEPDGTKIDINGVEFWFEPTAQR